MTQRNPDQSTQEIPWTVERAIAEKENSYPDAKPDAMANGACADDRVQEDRDYMCGLGSYYPRFLQRLANPKMFFFVYSIMGILQRTAYICVATLAGYYPSQGAYKTYFVGTLSTIERRFAMSSQTTGIILIADNLSPIITNILAGYYANHVSRPKILGFGSLLVAVSCFISIVPYMVYGPGLHILADSAPHPGARRRSPDSLLCNSAAADRHNCGSASLVDNYTPFALFFAANFLNGLGSSTFVTVGSTYVDDNTRKKNSPLYFGVGFAFRLLGPVLGFVTAGACLRFYENPFQDPGITPNDPRWVGAWWVGYILFSIGLCLVALPMMLFPRILPAGKRYKVNRLKKLSALKGVKGEDEEEGSGKHGFSIAVVKDILVILKRLASNPVFMFNSFGLTFVLLATAGYGTSFSKYVEFQFRQSASKANYYTGVAKVVTSVIGIVTGGVMLHLFRPRPRFVAAYGVFVELAMMAGFVALMFIGCESPVIAGITPGGNATVNSMLSPCNVNCNCNTQIYEPVCASNRMTSYFSPCHAGCRSVGTTSLNMTVYKDCSCIAHGSLEVYDGYATSGLCGPSCQKLGIFLGIVIVGLFLGSTGRVGGFLMFLRCVDPVDKSMALGTASSIVNVFAFIPYPLVYGAILDHSCIVWEEKCGRRGNCWIYDADKLRYTLHLTTVIFLAIGGACYIGQFLFSGRIKRFYEDDHDEDNTGEKDKYESTTTIIEALSVENLQKANELPEATRF